MTGCLPGPRLPSPVGANSQARNGTLVSVTLTVAPARGVTTTRGVGLQARRGMWAASSPTTAAPAVISV